MSTQTEELLVRHQEAVRAAMAEAARLADGMIITLGGVERRNEFVDIDLVATEVTVRRLKELQRTVIENSAAVQRLQRQALSEI